MAVAAPKLDFSPFSVLGRAHAHSKCCWCKSPMRAICDEQFWRCPKKECFARQRQFWIIVAAKGTNPPFVAFLPTPVQADFFEKVLSCKWTRILFGGSRGSSKSHALRWLAHYLCLKYPGFQILMLRRTLPELEKSQLKSIQREAEWLDAEYNSKYELHYSNESLLAFGHCAEKGDEAKFLSSAWDLVITDETTTFLPEQLIDIGTSARRSVRTPREWVPMMVGGTNPGGVAGNYCRTHYVTKLVSTIEDPYYNPDQWLYVASMLEDNPFLDLKEYDAALRQLGEMKYRAWRLGSWDSFEGQFFTEWRVEDERQADLTVKRAHVIKADKEWNIPQAVEYICCLDWAYGASNPKSVGVCYWVACCVDGKYVVVDEYVFNNILPKDVAKEIKRRNTENNRLIRFVAADPSMWAKGGETGESIAETFRKNGVVLQKAKNDRKIGWMRLRELLSCDVDGIPFLRVFGRKCPYACRTIPALIGNTDDPEDILCHPKQEDHCADSWRYFAMSRPRPTENVFVPREALRGKAGELRYIAAEMNKSNQRHHYGR
jgi:phage terminase large subunit